MNPPLTRLSQRPAGVASAEDRAAALVRADLILPAPDPFALERVRLKLRRSSFARSPRWGWRPATALAVLALSSLAAAAVVRWQPEWRVPFSRAEGHAAPVQPASVRRLEPRVAAVPPPALAPAEVPLAPLHPHRGAVRSRAEVPVAEPDMTAPIARSRSPLDDEVELLGEALQRLNTLHDAAGALLLLDSYQRRFPQGALAREGFVARIDALLATGQRRQVLEALDALTPAALFALPRGRELWILRGELLAESGDCPSAIAVFDEVLETDSAALRERALWGRATCRAARGDAAGSRKDLQRYLEWFPAGRFARSARTALEQ